MQNVDVTTCCMWELFVNVSDNNARPLTDLLDWCHNALPYWTENGQLYKIKIKNEEKERRERDQGRETSRPDGSGFEKGINWCKPSNVRILLANLTHCFTINIALMSVIYLFSFLSSFFAF
jgi:hypothetical protein